MKKEVMGDEEIKVLKLNSLMLYEDVHENILYM